MSNIEELRRIYAKHAPFDVKVDLSHLDPKRKEIIKKLIQATDIVDGIYWKQASHDALDWRKKYADPKTDDEKLIHELIEMNCGPYDRLNFNTAFIGDKPKRAPGAGFYPEDLTKEEFEAYIAKHPDRKEAFESPFTVIKRKGKELEAVWYHDEYKTEVTQIVKLLTECAELAEEPTLKRYLLQRSADLQTDNYYQSDCDWIDLKDPYIDFIIGPYEVYADNLIGIKTGFESVVMLKNEEETKKLDMYLKLIDEFEQCLPIDDRYKKTGTKLETPMIVVDSVYRGGEARRAMQFAAFSLPNDAKVLSEKGAKKVIHKNFQNARFNNIISPTAKHFLANEHHQYLSAECNNDFIIGHEIAHSLGPRFVYGTSGSINAAMKENYSPIEELRADVLSIYIQEYMQDKGCVVNKQKNAIYASFLASQLRSIRMGHGAYSVASTITFNFIAEGGGVKVENDKLKINYSLIGGCLRNLTEEVSVIEAEGDFPRAVRLMTNYNKKSPLITYLTQDIPNIPADNWPTYKI